MTFSPHRRRFSLLLSCFRLHMNPICFSVADLADWSTVMRLKMGRRRKERGGSVFSSFFLRFLVLFSFP